MADFPQTYRKTYRGTLKYSTGRTDENDNVIYETKTETRTGNDAKKEIDPDQIDKAINITLKAAWQGVFDGIAGKILALADQEQNETASQVVAGLNVGDSLEALANNIKALPGALIQELSDLIVPAATDKYHEKQAQYNEDAYNELVDLGCYNIY